jgi:hypothetical protein
MSKSLLFAKTTLSLSNNTAIKTRTDAAGKKMKSVEIKINPSSISIDACEDAGVPYPASGICFLREDGQVSFGNGIPLNWSAQEAARKSVNFKFPTEQGRKFGDFSNPHIFPE